MSVRVLVTGGAGFIGSTLVDRLLAEGYAVDVVDDLSTGSLANLAEARAGRRHELSFHQIDIRAADLVELVARRRPEVIFHLAAHHDDGASLTHPVFDADVNLVGGLHVLEGARAAGTRKVVFASSGPAVYGDVDPSDLPVRESQPQVPVSPHGAAKKAFGDYLAVYREQHDLEFTSLALANVYGPRQRAGVVAVFAERLLAGERCTVFGDGAQTRDLVYVDDVVDAFARAATRGDGLFVNVGTGVETSVLGLHRTMAAALGVAAPPEHAPSRPADIRRSCLDPGRAAIHLGWKSWTGLIDGVTEVLRRP